MFKKISQNLLILFVILIVLASLFGLSLGDWGAKTKIGFSEVVKKIEAGEVSQIEVEENKLNLTLKDGSELTSYKESADSLISILKDYDLPAEKIQAVAIIIKQPEGFWLLMSGLLPFLIPLILVVVFIYWMSSQAQKGQMKAMSFGQTNAKAAELKQKVTFKSVAGATEAKEELKEIVEFLKTPKKFTKLGAKVPKGAILLGAPGCGKTLLARAVAGEADVPFFNISGSEFVEMFVGVGASRVRDLFEKAKKKAPAIIFIDEIDAVGRQRGAGFGGGHDEREQTLNQILVEMDGFDQNTNVIVLAATNRPDVLDPALLRPGRFDRRIVIAMPDIKAREEILNIHAQNKPLAKNVSLKEIARRTPGFSGADLANLLNEAAILTARNNDKIVTKEAIMDSIEKVILGPERKSHVLSDKEKEITAYHEAGHALASALLPNCDPVRKVSIISRGNAGGYTLNTPDNDSYLRTKAYFLDQLTLFLGGYAAERLVFKEITTGASSDLKRATDLARSLVTDYGMSETLGPRTFGKKEDLIFLGREISEQQDYSEETARDIDKEVSNFIDKAYQRAVNLLSANRDKLEKIAQELLSKETLDQKEFEKLINT
ncbi:MAG: ATP-dependent zinc metalloprotease FtsH [Patescibacteria group bacterium]